MISVGALIGVGVAVLLLGLAMFVIASTVRLPVKLWFTFLCVSLSLWSIANGLVDAIPEHALLLTRLTFIFGAMALMGLTSFVMYFPKKLHLAHVLTLILGAYALFISMLSSSSLVIPSVDIKDGYTNVDIGPFYWIYFMYALVSALSAISILAWTYRTEQGINRERVRYVLVGLAITSVLVLMTNLILPLISGSSQFANYGSLSVLILIGFVNYAIIKHHLFSIRVATARAAAYLASGLFVGVVFAVMVFNVASNVFQLQPISANERFFYIAAALAVGLAFNPVKNFFDKLTKKIFLRDLYDPETVLTRMAEILSESKSSKVLIESIAKELYENIHPSFVEGFVKRDDRWNRYGLQGVINMRNSVRSIRQIASAADDSVIILSSEDDTLMSEDIGVLIVLQANGEAIGYISLGHKRNGTSYTQQDKNLLEAVADEAAIAAESLLRYEAIEKFNETLKARIDEATGELRRNNKKLQALDVVKDEFISMASHQLRTPLTSIKGYLSMVLEGDAGELNSTQRKFLEEAYNSSQRMVFLIGDFLNVSRLNTGKFIIEFNRTNLADVVAEEVDQLQPSAAARQMHIEYHKPSHFPLQSLDENKLRQVVMNFMDNAIYYSKPGGVIKVELTYTSKDVTLKVKDQGIGVPLAQQHRLFEKFYRATNAQKARPDGSGIGLFLAKKVIVAHKGSVIFESAEGKGSTFGFKIPLTLFDEPKVASATAASDSTTKVAA